MMTKPMVPSANMPSTKKKRAPAVRNMAPKTKTVLRGIHNPVNQLPPHAFHRGKRQSHK